MKNVLVSCYKHFNQFLGNHPLLNVLKGIMGGRWKKPVMALRDALAAGDRDGAEKIKKSLPAFTVSAFYEGARRKECMKGYNCVVILDIDKLDADEVDPVVWKASDSVYTLFAFRSPGGRGVKIGVDPLAEGGQPLIGHALTVENHRATFEACKGYYEALLGIEVDPSGKDPGRLCFVSWDPDMYLAENRDLKSLRSLRSLRDLETPGNSKVPKTPNSPKEHSPTFKRLRRKISRKIKYADGSRNNYLYSFAILCCEEGIPIDATLTYCLKQFKDLPENEIRPTLQSAYTRFSGQPEGKKEQKKASIIREIQYELGQHYQFRYNQVMNCIEYRRPHSIEPFRMLDKKKENTMWCDLMDKSINCSQKTMQAVLLSDFTPDYHPFREYFNNLPAWDGVTDHITAVADRVQTTNPEWWHECFRRWIVALVACAIQPGVENHTVLMLDGEQGTGKTRWCCNLVPPELHEYRHSGPANPRSKDIRIGMSQCLLINLDELHALDEMELNQMKEMITTGVIRERVPYGERANQHERVCSYTASIDSSLVLTDINGSRRFLCFHVLSIDYLSPIDYAALYSQAVSLLNDGFKYWFDRSEIELFNANNEEFRIHYPEEELFYTYYRKPRPDEAKKSYLTTAQILHQLCLKSFLKITPKSTKLLASVLKKAGFEQVRRQNRRLFVVVELTQDEIRAEKEGTTEQTEENGKGTDKQGTLPL